MSNDAIALAKTLRAELPLRFVPPSEGTRPGSEMILAHSMVKSTRGYIEKVTYQINGCYEKGWYDACAVMMRRLMETLIIEVFEKYQLAQSIKNPRGDFFYLSDLIDATLKEPSWNLGRNTRKALPDLKHLGDQSAHSRRFIAHRKDVDDVMKAFRVVVQELIFLAGLK